MCFCNNKKKLDKVRSRKKPIRVWKRVYIDDITGEAYSRYTRVKKRTVWKQGEIVKPHKKRKPLADMSFCSAGLYFYVGEMPDCHKGEPGFVVATVKPEDVIATDGENFYICATEAKVINDPNPERLKKKKERLAGQAKRAKERLKGRVEIIKEWYEGGREEWEEAYQQLKDELKQTEEEIRAKKSKTKPK